MRCDSVAALEMKVMLATTSAEWADWWRRVGRKVPISASSFRPMYARRLLCAKRKRTAAHKPQFVLHVPKYTTVGDNSVMRHLL
jgi:hypothetical protein